MNSRYLQSLMEVTSYCLMLKNELREAHTKDDKLKIKNKFKKSNVFSPIGIIMNLLYLRNL